MSNSKIETDDDLFTLADNLTCRMFPLYQRNEKLCVGKPIKFLQYDRPGSLFWHYVVENLLESGATEKQIEEILTNKGIRKCLDSENLGEAFKMLATLFVAELKMVN